MRILLVEDDSATAQSIELMLKMEGMCIQTTDLGEEAIDLAKVYDYDLVLLDLNLPDMGGMTVLRRLRAAKIETPVIVQTGDTSTQAKVDALSAGADDFMTKPFHKDELVARIHAVIRRSKGHAQSLISVGDIAIDLKSKTVSVSGREVRLTGREYLTLEALVLRKGNVITKDVVMNHLYGGLDEPGLKIIDVFVCKLRKKLRLAGARPCIETIWGRGFVVREPDATQASA